MTTPVSIVVTSYNHAAYIDLRMRSVLAQTHPEKEILVIDDRSTDDSWERLQHYRSSPGVTLVLRPENGGYAATCNHGVSLSRGPYVMIAQSDDFDEPPHVERLADALDRHPTAGVAFCGSRLVDERGHVFGSDFAFRERAFQSLARRDVLLPSAVMERFLLTACVVPNLSAALFRKDLFTKVKGLTARFRSLADWDFWCRLARETDFYYVAEPLNYFRCHRTTIRSSFPPFRQMEETMEVLYAARARAKVTPWENVRFRINMAFFWVDAILRRPLQWVFGWRQALRLLAVHDRWLWAYFPLGGVVKVGKSLQRWGRLLLPCHG